VRMIRIAAMLALGSWLSPDLPALAQDALPTPKVVIYPGDIIRDEMIADSPSPTVNGQGPFAEARATVVGKMARRTLLPGAAIPISGLEAPRLVSNGHEVQLVYSESGLVIVTTGSALQDGVAGEIIKVRNTDSGVTVSGAVQPDGTVRVSGG
jgi:flagellar basal body P-ring formation protein FlgA